MKKLLDLMFPAHPEVGVDEQLASLPKAKEMAEINRKNQIESFHLALNDQVSSQRLGFLCLLAAINYLDRGAVSAVGPRLDQSLNIGPEIWGRAVGIFTIS